MEVTTGARLRSRHMTWPHRQSGRMAGLIGLAILAQACSGAAGQPPIDEGSVGAPGETGPLASAEASRLPSGPSAPVRGRAFPSWEQPIAAATGLEIADDRVFVFAGNDVQALDAGTGTQAWSYRAEALGPEAARLGCACAAGGTLVGDRIYTVSRGDTVVALARESGEKLWSHQVGKAVASLPIVRDGTVAVVAADPAGFFLAGLDDGTGRVRWETRPTSPIFPVATPADGLVLTALAGGGAAAFRLDNGQLAWATPEPAAQDLFDAAQVGSGLLALKTSDGIVAVDTRAGTVLSRWQLAARPAAVIVSAERVYVGMSSGELAALDPASGAERWRMRLPSGVDSDGLLLGEQMLYAVTEDNRLAAVSLETGELLWMDVVPGAFARPALAGDALLVGTLDGEVHVVDQITGEWRGNNRVPGSVFESPAAAPWGFLVMAEQHGGATLATFIWEVDNSASS